MKTLQMAQKVKRYQYRESNLITAIISNLIKEGHSIEGKAENNSLTTKGGGAYIIEKNISVP